MERFRLEHLERRTGMGLVNKRTILGATWVLLLVLWANWRRRKYGSEAAHAKLDTKTPRADNLKSPPNFANQKRQSGSDAHPLRRARWPLFESGLLRLALPIFLLACSVTVGFDAYYRYTGSFEVVDRDSESFIRNAIVYGIITPILPSNQGGSQVEVSLAVAGTGLILYSALDAARGPTSLEVAITLADKPSNPPPIVGVALWGAAEGRNVRPLFPNESSSLRTIPFENGQIVLAPANRTDDNTGNAQARFIVDPVGRFAVCEGSRCWYNMPFLRRAVYSPELADPVDQLRIDALKQGYLNGSLVTVDSNLRLRAGWLSLASRAERADPPLTDSSDLNWQSKEELWATAEVFDSRKEAANQRDIFIAAVEAGIVATLVPWTSQLLLDLRRSRRRPSR